MEELKEKLEKQREEIKEIKKDIKWVKRVYFTGLILKVIIILLPAIAILLSIPKILEIYEEVMNLTA